MEVRYVGPHDSVDVPVPPDAPGGARVVTVANGDTVTTSKDHGEQLLAQKDNWAPVPARKAKAKDGDGS